MPEDSQSGNSGMQDKPSLSRQGSESALNDEEDPEGHEEADDHAGPLVSPVPSNRAFPTSPMSSNRAFDLQGVGQASVSERVVSRKVSQGPLVKTMSERKVHGSTESGIRESGGEGRLTMTKTKSEHRPSVMKTRSERQMSRTSQMGMGKTMSERSNSTSVAVSNLGGGCRKVSLTIPSLSNEIQDALGDQASEDTDQRVSRFGSIEEDQSSNSDDDSSDESDHESQSVFAKSRTEPTIKTKRSSGGKGKIEVRESIVTVNSPQERLRSGSIEEEAEEEPGFEKAKTEPVKDKSEETGPPAKPFTKPEGAVGAEEARDAFTSNLLRKGLHLGAPIDQERFKELQIALDLVVSEGTGLSAFANGLTGIVAPIGSVRGQALSAAMSQAASPALSGARSPAGGPGQGPPKNPLLNTMARIVQPSQQQSMQPSLAQSAVGSYVGSKVGSRSGSPTGSRAVSRQGSALPSAMGSAVPSCTGSRRGSKDGPDRRRSVLNAPEQNRHRRPSGITAALAKLASKALPSRMMDVFAKYSAVFREAQNSRRMVKSVNDLAEELETGGCRLEGDENSMRRIVSVCALRIVGPKAVVLVQKWQRDEKGKWRRKNALPGTKMKSDEDAFTCVQKILSKDLPQLKGHIKVNQDAPLEHLMEEKESKSYPGVFTQYNTTVVEAVVDSLDEEVLAKMGLGPKAQYHGSFLQSTEGADVTYAWMPPRTWSEDEVIVRGERGALPKRSDIEDSTADPESEDDAMVLNERFAILARTLAERDPQHLRSTAELTDIGLLRLRDLVEYLRREQEGGTGASENTEVNRQMVLDMLTTLNGGQPPRQCTCKPGEPHTCMSPAASLFASFAPSLHQSRAHSLFHSAAASKAQSLFHSTIHTEHQSRSTSRRGSTERIPSVRLSVTDGEDPVILGDPPRRPSVLSSTARGSVPLNRESNRKSLTVDGERTWNEARAESSARGSPALRDPEDDENVLPLVDALEDHPLDSPTQTSRKRVSWEPHRLAKEGIEEGQDILKTQKPVSVDDLSSDTNVMTGVEPDSPCGPVQANLLTDQLNLLNLETMQCMSRDSIDSLDSRNNEQTQLDELSVTVSQLDKRNALEKRKASLTHRTSVFDVVAPELPPGTSKNGDPYPWTKQYNTVAHCQLAEMLQNGQGVLVVDVRGRDFKGGHIPGAMHIATSVVLEGPEEIAEASRQRGASHVVFTCMYSVSRSAFSVMASTVG
eukprot:gnl/MRDRNA2_/MRDRNA2_56062_c0_seq2.p1 gnl/MRDRNA2_/MRDRNA2_56062_c0~~gnl/MRDRNA2_/MRDRNA2_56062_c0_seq2.p1  ORF type:complete len:1247 (-),score=248.31 gnl/MRDRNA2_/MRDRNA2_56062_c0_seq2:297-3950(-)